MHDETLIVIGMVITNINSHYVFCRFRATRGLCLGLSTSSCRLIVKTVMLTRRLALLTTAMTAMTSYWSQWREARGSPRGHPVHRGVRHAMHAMRAMRGAVRMVRGEGCGLARLLSTGQLPLAPGWHKTANVAPPAVRSFMESQGPTTMLPPGTAPSCFFDQIFELDYSEKLAEATNINAVVKSPPVGDGPHERLATADCKWHATTAIEMGIKKDLPEYKDYWATDPILHDAIVLSVMTRLRYEKLSQYLHCSIAANEDAVRVPGRCRQICGHF